MVIKASLLKGTRDFLPNEMRRRQYMFHLMRKVFEKYGFDPLNTPAMEKIETLTGKYGEEGEKLLFRILNNGDFLSKADLDEGITSEKLAEQISKRGLRYDLTIPFARMIAMNSGDISFPFKRYQIQPVWRADRPQKGRYQEFYQCDIDAIGSDSLMYESDCVCIYDEVFQRLGIPVTIRMNHRKVLSGAIAYIDKSEIETNITTAIDKIEKLGWDGVSDILKDLGLKGSELKVLGNMCMENQPPEHEFIRQGQEELEKIKEYLKLRNITNEMIIDYSLARGLDYYTGTIFEVIDTSGDYGSLGGGGRYDELTEIFGLKNVSGVGISFGAERIFDVMTEQNLWPEESHQNTELLILTLDEKSHKVAYQILPEFYKAGIKAELYPSPTKMKKQMKYANEKNVNRVLIIGDEERTSKLYMLKDMHTGKQEKLPIGEILLKLSK